jgi:hypothetical protein
LRKLKDSFMPLKAENGVQIGPVSLTGIGL